MENKKCPYCQKFYHFKSGSVFILIANPFKGEHVFPDSPKFLLLFNEERHIPSQIGDNVFLLEDYCVCVDFPNKKIKALYKNTTVLLSEWDITTKEKYR